MDIPSFDELLKIVTPVTANRSTWKNHSQSVVIRDARPVVPKLSSADSKGSVTSSQGIRGYISVMTTLKFTYIFKVKE